LATLIAISDEGEDNLADDEVVREALRRNWIVWAVDPRGMGKLRSESRTSIFVLSLWLDENFAWRQAQDVQRIIEGVGAFNQNHKAALYTRGPNSSGIAALATILAGRNLPEWIAVRDGVRSFWDPKLPLYAAPFGMQGIFDMGDLEARGEAKIWQVTNAEEFIRRDW
jgi:hypothetical protein